MSKNKIVHIRHIMHRVSDKYKNVYMIEKSLDGRPFITRYVGQVMIKGVTKRAHFKTEREAAIYVDTILIKAGKKPVNILKSIDNGKAS